MEKEGFKRNGKREKGEKEKWHERKEGGYYLCSMYND